MILWLWKAIVLVIEMIKKKRFVSNTVFIRITSLILAFSFVFMLCSCAPDNSRFDGIRFSNTRKISVMSDSSDLALEEYIHDAVLRDCNIDVVFFSSGNFNQDYGIVPDVAYMYNTNRLNTYYKMNSILNISPYLDTYGSDLSELVGILGEESVYNCSSNPSEIWYLTPQRDDPDAMVTFIRADWLDKLGLSAPSDIDDLHECLVAFRDNAGILLGADSSEMIPFFVDNKPNISCKPLFDSCFDTDINDADFYINGYCRVTQDGYLDGLKTLNDWYLEGLLPADFQNIVQGTKESYMPIEQGYVGAFCAKYDYLYQNGDNSHISALHENRGDKANYIAVNTFKNADGIYTSWQEDYLEPSSRNIFLPSTCSDPLACLVYLNWLSKAENIENVRNFAENSSSRSIGERYLLTMPVNSADKDMVSDQYSEAARQTASEVEVIRRGSLCVRYDPSIFVYVISDIDITAAYPRSTGEFTCGVICSPEDDYDETYQVLFNEYLAKGAGYICSIRESEWSKVIDRGVRYPM